MKNIALTIKLVFVALMLGCNAKTEQIVEREVPVVPRNLSYNDFRKQPHLHDTIILLESEGSANQIWRLGEKRFLHEIAHRCVVEINKKAKTDPVYAELCSKYTYEQLYKAAETYGSYLLDPSDAKYLEQNINWINEN